MRARYLLVIVAVVLVAGGAAAAWLILHKPAPPDLAWAPYEDDYRTKRDFARLEHELPLSPAALVNVTPASLKALDQERVNQLYARLTAGPIPDGPFDGDLFFPTGVSGEARLSEIVGGLKGLALDIGEVKIELLGRALWKGKVFYRDARILRNRIDDLAVLKPILGDTGDIKRLTFEGTTTWLLFPAKLYCGQSLLDGRRESIIIDYAFSDDIKGYRENPDFLAGRRGLDVRDEIRMIRPGFFLGRAYLNRVFALNFTLYNAEIAKRDGPAFLTSGRVPEDCWAGTQRVADLPH